MKPLHSASGTGIGYNPGISYRGGELLGAGLAQAGNALAEGLQQFTKNREEREFADQKMQALAAQMGRFQDFEKASNEDDTSPAGQFIKTFANWDNLSLAKKKAALVDAELFVNKRESEQRRAEDQQWRMLGEQRAIEEQQRRAKLESDRLAEELRSNRVREDLAWLNRMDTAGQRVFDNVRAMDADRRAEAEAALRMRAATQADEQRIATLEAARALLGESSLAGSPLSRLTLGGALPDVKALGEMRDLMQPQAVPGSLQDVPGAPGYKFGIQSRSGAGSFLPVGQATTRSVDPLKLEQEIRATTEAYTKAGTPAERGAFLDQLRRLESMRTGAPAPAAPAQRPATSAPAAADKVVVEKDGKKFRLPKAQLDQAQREGYKLVPQAP